MSAGAEAADACMAAIELPPGLPLAATVADALWLLETLRSRFKVEVRRLLRHPASLLGRDGCVVCKWLAHVWTAQGCAFHSRRRELTRGYEQ